MSVNGARWDWSAFCAVTCLNTSPAAVPGSPITRHTLASRWSVRRVSNPHVFWALGLTVHPPLLRDNVPLRRTILPMRKLPTLALGIIFALTLSACSDSGEKAVVPVDTVTNEPAAADSHSHARGDGTIAAIQGVSIDIVPSTLSAGKEANLQFTLARFDEPIMDYVLKHEYPVHVVVVSDDLGSYQHLHPTMGKNGVWQLPITFDAGGRYRIVADFVVVEGTDDVNYVVGTDIQVGGPDAQAFTLPAPAESIEVDGYVVSVSGSVSAAEHSMLMFTVTKDGVPVEFENWLGASGHLVAIRQGDLAYAHMHPSGHSHDSSEADGMSESDMTVGDSMSHGAMSMPGMIHFDAEFPAGAGTYRLFLQFQVGGKLSTAAFTAVVS